MPLKRTPPKNKKELPINKTQQAIAEVDINTIGDTSDTAPQYSGSDNDNGNTDKSNRNLSNRNNKRRAPNTPPQVESTKDMGDFMEEMRALLNTLSNQQEKRLCEMKASMNALHADIKDSINFLSEKYDNVIVEIQSLKEEKLKDKKCIKQLEDRIEMLERQSRSSSLELRNIPTKLDENKTDLTKIMINLSQKLGTPIQCNEIKNIFRINSTKSGKPIITELNSVITKDNLMKAYKTYNKNQNEKLNTSDLKIDGPKIPVFLSEGLTSKAKKIFFLARSFASENNYRHCWTTNGRVFMRIADGTPIIRIEDEDDLRNLARQS